MPIPTGSKAPDFILSPNRRPAWWNVKLSNNFGKKNTVLLFFPLGVHQRLHEGNVRP